MGKAANNNYDLIDIFKFFFACCVVLIHTEISKELSNGFYLQEMLFRLAVPFFFVSSGFLSSQKELSSANLKKSLKKMISIYMIWSFIYIFATYFRYDFDYTYLFDQFIRFFFLSADNIMWFIGSVIFSMIVIFHLGKNKKYLIISLVTAFLLYLFGLFFTTYNFIPKNTFFTELVTYLSKTFYANRNPIFSGYLYFGIGYYMSLYCKDNKLKLKHLIILIPLDILFLFLESKLIYQNLNSLIEYDFLIMHIPTIILLFLVIKNIKKLPINTIKIRKISAIMYYIHILILFTYQYLIINNYLHLDINSKKLDLLVLTTTIIISWLANELLNYKRKEVIR